MSDSIKIEKIKEDKTHVWVTFDKVSDEFLDKLKAACLASERGFEITDEGVIKFKHLTSKTYAESQARKLIRDICPAKPVVKIAKAEPTQTREQTIMELPKFYNLVRIISQIGAILGCLVGIVSIFIGLATFKYGIIAGFSAISGGVFIFVGALVSLGIIYCFLDMVKAQIESRNAIISYTSKRN